LERFDSEVEVEAAKDVPYCQPILRAVKLLSEVYSMSAAEEEDYYVVFSIDGIQYTVNIR
jgi:hypothetical protein